MKLTAFLLSFYFLLIVSQPVLAAVARTTSMCPVECGSMKAQPECPKKESSSCPKETSCPLTCCNAFQCTFCCGALVEENSFGINLNASAINFPGAELILPSSYAADCWQPPELA
jgi:hypothetical protein